MRATSIPNDWLLKSAEKRCSNNKLALIWIKHFDQWSRKRQVGEFRMLILDGYPSYITHNFLKYCANNKIIPYLLLSYTTQLIQPLDIAVFGPYKHWHGEAIGDHNRLGLTAVTKVDFLDMIKGFRTKAMKTGTIQKAFRMSGSGR